MTGSWQGGFQGELTVTNTGTSATAGWTLAFTFANGQVITQMWGGTPNQVGADVTVKNVSWNGALAPNASTTAGFLANWNTTNAIPTVRCTVG